MPILSCWDSGRGVGITSTFGDVCRQMCRREPIEARKAAFAKFIRRAKTGLVLNEHIDEPGDIVFRHAWR
jgi:hypothetical protein